MPITSHGLLLKPWSRSMVAPSPITSFTQSLSRNQRQRKHRLAIDEEAFTHQPTPLRSLTTTATPSTATLATTSWKGKEKETENEFAAQIKPTDVGKESAAPLRLPRLVKRTQFDSLLVPGTASVSLTRLQEHVANHGAEDPGSLLRLVLWLSHLPVSPTNDTPAQKRRWGANLYRRAGKEHERGFSSHSASMAVSIDILCAKLLKNEFTTVDLDREDVELLEQTAGRALQGNGFRTLQAARDTLAAGRWKNTVRIDNDTLVTTLSVYEHTITLQCRVGMYASIWSQRNNILKLLWRQKALGGLRVEVDEEWRMDTVLLKALIGACADTNTSRKKSSPTRERGQEKLSIGREQFKHGVVRLYKEIENIYGAVSDAWLTRFIVALGRGVEPGAFGRKEWHWQSDYLWILPTLQFAQDTFHQHCTRSIQLGSKPSTELMLAMLDVEMHLDTHCSRMKSGDGRDRISIQKKSHRSNIRGIVAFMSGERTKGEEEESKHISTEDSGIAPPRLQDYARMIHTKIKLLLLSGKLPSALSALRHFVYAFGPDEAYEELANGKALRYRRAAKKMLPTRKLIRAATINIAVYLESCAAEERIAGLLELSRLNKDSVERGAWDPWLLERSDRDQSLRPLSLKRQLINPPAELAMLYDRMLRLCRPVRPLSRGKVQPGFEIIANGTSTSTYWSLMENLTQAGQAVKKRAEKLDEEGHGAGYVDGNQWRGPMKRIFDKSETSAAQCIWALFANANELDEALTRLRLLLYDALLFFEVPARGWKSARRALVKQGTLWGSEHKDVQKEAMAMFKTALQRVPEAVRLAVEQDEQNQAMGIAEKGEREVEQGTDEGSGRGGNVDRWWHYDM